MAGFEAADHVNAAGIALDLAHDSAHDRQYRNDYRRARALGLSTVRESVGWRIAERGSTFDFSRAVRYAREAQRQGIEVVWSLWHYGTPADVDAFDPACVGRFAAFCSAAARALRPYVAADAWFNPVNEISFLCWLLTEGRTGAPWTGDGAARAYALKTILCRAAVRGAGAIRAEIPHARFLHTDPVIHAVAADDTPADVDEARRQVRAQYDAWDLLFDPAFEPDVPVAARAHAMGLNHYHSSQWSVPTRKPLRWHLRDPRRRPLSDLAEDVHARYGVPFAIAETSHFGGGRGDWIRDIAREILRMQARGLPVIGACLYPFVDRPDWERPGHWHRSGVCDVVPREHPLGGRRSFNRSYCHAFEEARRQSTSARAAPRRQEGTPMDALIVFCHLRWDSVWQRPQHLITRFAQRYRVLVVEEPCFEEGPPRAEIVSPHPGVHVLRPHTSIAAGGFHDDQIPALQPLVKSAIEELGFASYGIHTFTPMAVPLMQELSPRVIAYDCMDELSAFRHAPRQLPQRESALFRIANVVFTGGPSLYRSKRAQHDDVHCFPSSVDAGHFAAARRGAHAHVDIAALPRPRFGFYGVIDERFDAGLAAQLARARPHWQWCYVGPVVKIDPALLPRAPNLHWLPQQPYAALPSLVAGWDVCVLPFARNEHTRFISPTKTLEYLAADKPVVSTPIADVVELYGEAIRVASDADAFIEACEAMLDESPDARARRVQAAREMVQRTSWDATARAMIDILEHRARGGLRDEARTLLAGPTPPRSPTVPATAALGAAVGGGRA
jgi:glycosyltransferase involved in cell wall biosynthesis